MTQGPPWDGAPLPPPSVPGTIQLVRSPSTAAPVGPWVLLAAALGAVLGALLPWAVLELQVGPGLRTHLAGTDGDGVATLMLGLVLGLAAVVAFLQPRLGLWAGILGLVAGSATTLDRGPQHRRRRQQRQPGQARDPGRDQRRQRAVGHARGRHGRPDRRDRAARAPPGRLRRRTDTSRSSRGHEQRGRSRSGRPPATDGRRYLGLGTVVLSVVIVLLVRR